MEMATQRVHPSAVDSSAPPQPADSSVKQPPMGDAYVVQIPRDQVLRYPAPENARRFEALSRGGTRGGCCRRCCCCFLCVLLTLIVALGIAAGVLYLVFRFRAPNYSVTDVAIRGMNVTSTSPGPISPVFDVAIRADNPNHRVGIYYLEDSEVDVFFDGLLLSGGSLPVFYQPPRNVTIIETALTGSDVVLGAGAATALFDYQTLGLIPFSVNVRAPVKIRVGSVNTWRFSVRVRCDVVVNSLSSTALIVNNDCHYRVRPW